MPITNFYTVFETLAGKVISFIRRELFYFVLICAGWFITVGVAIKWGGSR